MHRTKLSGPNSWKEEEEPSVQKREDATQVHRSFFSGVGTGLTTSHQTQTGEPSVVSKCSRCYGRVAEEAALRPLHFSWYRSCSSARCSPFPFLLPLSPLVPQWGKATENRCPGLIKLNCLKTRPNSAEPLAKGVWAAYGNQKTKSIHKEDGHVDQ